MIVAYVYNNNPKSKFFGQIGWCHLNAEGELQIAPVYVRYKFRKTIYTNASSFPVIRTLKIGNKILCCGRYYKIMGLQADDYFSVINDLGQRCNIAYSGLLPEDMVHME